MSDDLLVGGHALKHMLSNVDMNKGIESLKKDILSTKSVSKKDQMIKKLKYMAGIHSQGLKPDQAYVLHNIPVLPASDRPISIGVNNKIEYPDVVQLYREHIIANNALDGVKDDLEPSELINERRDLYNHTAALFGVADPVNVASKAQGVKGILRQVAGVKGPKTGYFQSKILSKKQDFSGRGTIFAEPNLKFNEIGIPKESIWTLYKFHGIRDLVKKGYSYVDASKAWETRNDAANVSFNKLVKEVPVIVNRNPTLMRSNETAFFPKPIDGRSYALNPLVLPLFAGDFDGDAQNLYLPMSPEAVAETKQKLLAEHQKYDFRKGLGNSLVAPGHEAILGSMYLTEPDGSQKVHEFKTEKDALAALQRGEIKKNTPIKILS